VEGAAGEPAFLLSDTVGFIRRLPHHLVASFHATLEEAAQADLLLHVADASSPFVEEHVRAVNGTLKELGLDGRPCRHVLNKADIAPPDALQRLAASLPAPVFAVSAATGRGLPALLAHIREAARAGRRRHGLRFPAADGRRLALLGQLGALEETRYEGDWCVAQASLDDAALARLRALPGEMQVETGAS
jgi:GTP-binding protein HflX